jgi:hypothetical protein
MTTFSITGLRGGKEEDTRVTVTWTDGELSGDEDAIAMIRELAWMYEGQSLRAIVGPTTTHDHLSNPYTACMLIKRVFRTRTTTQIGSLPIITLPPGAIA